MGKFLVAIAALAAAALAQTGAVTQTFTFTNALGPQGMQEITNAVRTTLQLREVSAQMDARTLTVQAAPSDLALTQWLFSELDTPAAPLPANLQVDRCPLLTDAADQLRVFRLSHISTTVAFQQAVNMVRVIPEITRAFPSSRTWSIAIRASEDRLDMAQWLLQQLDQPAAAPGQTRAEQQYHAPSRSTPEVRVMYFGHSATAQTDQEIVNAIRTIPQLTHVFPANDRRAVALGGAAGPIGLAEWLFSQLDKSGPQASAASSAAYEITPGVDDAQVFFLSGLVTDEAFQEALSAIRASTQSRWVMGNPSTRALVIRGTPDQLAQAQRALRDAGKL